MAALDEFSRQFEARLAAARHEPRWQPAETAEFMAQLESRRRHFEEIAIRVVQTIVRPRMQAVAAHFPNAAPDRTGRSDRSAYWFGYCERFPADVKVEIAVEHDERIENLVIHCELYIMPVFLKFDPHDKLTMPLAAVDEQSIANWVEAKLLAFLDTYLQLDRGEDDFEDEVVVDPVCGMRLSRSSASAQMDYRGHLYLPPQQNSWVNSAEEAGLLAKLVNTLGRTVRDRRLGCLSRVLIGRGLSANVSRDRNGNRGD